MRHFSQDHENMPVVDARGERLGRIAGIEDGEARLEPKTGVESRMEAAAAPETDALAIKPEQVVEVDDDEYIRIELSDE
ncbi:hypothetical protein [Halolamina salifodinae]|uniref:Uncharacterized protein n=1 Tax=Halolamina salifodinae TaxID=1202767 RepID=A0A8T4GS38_9EURY|nr:hypothetical protein [Halolamina salifodinae]MBP1985847.1 hypothetical protein [Halolamina salifodinae]